MNEGIDPQKLINLTSDIDMLAKDSIKKISDIIENELKEVAVKYNIPAENLILQQYPVVNNIQTYVIAIKIAGFTIENKFTA